MRLDQNRRVTAAGPRFFEAVELHPTRLAVTELRPLAHDLLSPERLRRTGLFDPEFVAQLQDEHERGIANHRKLLWTLLSFELWRESFVETPRRIETSMTA